MRDEAFVRSEIRWLIDRARLALGLPETAVVGCTDEQIARIVDAQQISSLPPPLDELLRYAGVQADGTVLSELVPSTGIGWDVMLDAKGHARQTAAISGGRQTFGADRVVFLSDPGGSVLWVDAREVDSAVWGLGERRPAAIDAARLACWLEREVVGAESR